MLKRFALALALLGTCATSMAQTAAQTTPSMFVFQNNFWLNLHEFLRGEIYRRGANLPPGIDLASLSDAERTAWSSALDVYTDVAKQDQIFDDKARRISNTLAMTGDAVRLRDGLLDARTNAALNGAAPIYRARLWPARQRDNAAWNAAAKALVDRHYRALSAALAKAYGVTWPRGTYLVDAVGETGANSGFTHEGPSGFVAHIHASVGSVRNAGDAPLELMFHEASHVSAVSGRLQKMIGDESVRQKLSVTPDLWHFMIMFVGGVVTQRELEKTGAPGYRPYFDRYNQIPPAIRSALERDWLPYLDGKVSFKQALHDLIREAR